jgi:hypothetical protein
MNTTSSLRQRVHIQLHRQFVAACLVIIASFSPSLAQRAEIIIPAAELAKPDQRADMPTPGKWWLNRDAKDWGARDGIILMAGEPSQQEHKPDGLWQVIPMFRFVPYRVPELVIDPKVSGWYRIHVGLYGDEIEVWSRPHLLGKLSGEPFPEYLQTPRGATSRVAEAYWKAADLTGKTIHILQPPAPMAHKGAGWMGGISHIRLVPMSEQEVAAAKHEIELPPLNQRLFAMLDVTDEIFWNGTAETEEDIHAMIWRHQQAGFGRIYWRCFGTCLDNSPAVPAAAPRWSDEDEAAWKEKNHCVAGWKDYFGLAQRFDPLKVAVEYGRTIGADVHAMVRLTNFNRPPYANFWHDHPEFRAQMLAYKKDENGKRIPTLPYKRVPYSRVLSFAYPEVRTFYVSFLKQIASTGTKGILLDMLRHPPIAGYEPIVADEFKKRFGKDMEPLDVYSDPQIQELFSEYLRAFLVELRAAVGPDIEIAVRCRGPEAFGFRGKEFIEAGLVNTIMDAHWYSGNGPRPTIDATVAAVGTKGKALAGADHFDDVDPANNWARRKGFLSPGSVEALAKAYSGRGVTAFGLYESTLHVWDPDARRAIRAAGWNYDPRKTTGSPPPR